MSSEDSVNMPKDLHPGASETASKPAGKTAGKTATSTKTASMILDESFFSSQAAEPARYQQLVMTESTLTWSMWAVRLAIFVDALTGAVLQPNYAIMAREGAHEDSFPNTNPFDFNSATYFIPLTAKLGIALSSLGAGWLSDRVGRKPVIQACVGGSALMVALKWFLRETFWGFCIANLFNGLLSPGMPVAMAYVGEIVTDTDAKVVELGMIGGLFVLGNASGGIIAILMESQGLFAPLWVAVALLVVTLVFVSRYMVESRKNLTVLSLAGVFKKTNASSLNVEDQDKKNLSQSLLEKDNDNVKHDISGTEIEGGVESAEFDEDGSPRELNQLALWNIIVGALADNFGSNGLFPLCLSPLAFNQWTMNFVESGEDPILSVVGYKWMSTLVALVVVPSTLVCPWVFNQIGAAGGCVFGNIMTAVLTIALLMLGTQEPTAGWMGAFIAVMYVGFPFTVISQLSTGPMLDTIAPSNRRGYVQGLNSSVMNLGGGFAPWLLGILADAASTEAAIWTGVGLSFGAALINLPLMWRPGMGIPPKDEKKKEGQEVGTVFDWEDAALIDKIKRGEYVPAAVRDKLNDERMKNGQPYLVVHTSSYEEDKDGLQELLSQAKADFTFLSNRNCQILANLAGDVDQDNLAKVLEKVNASLLMVGEDQVAGVYNEIGQWFANYIRDNGYYAHLSPTLMKQLIMAAFPPIMQEKEFRPENLEQFLVNQERVHRHFIGEVGEKPRYSVKSIFGDGHAKTFYG